MTLGTHNSTHVDAPWHYNSTIEGRRAETIEELPLEWFFGPGVVVDFTDKLASQSPAFQSGLWERAPHPPVWWRFWAAEGSRALIVHEVPDELRGSGLAIAASTFGLAGTLPKPHVV
jgi:hypothetical protein